ncbi:hypothetical protein ACH5RR_019735 [Cinchona calisaya]|uniref:Membrane-associated kinase regulator 6 n=1 Tax=Cinchona calisaya TaxID=153742 RepID=A0ABD2ZQ75_9GENT
MESSTPSLSIESFSHSWLVNLKPSFESIVVDHSKSSCSTSFDASDEASFIEMDPKMPPSRRFSRVPKDFSFDFRTSPSPLTLADAADLISADGFLIPLMNNDEAADQSSSSSPTPAGFVVSSLKEKEVLVQHSSSNRVRCSSLRRCKRLSKRIFQKYLDFLRPFCQKLRGHGSATSRVASISSSNEGMMIKNVEFYSPAASPRTSVAWSADNWRRSCDSESSIYEAVLHCKRTHHGTHIT